ncbi:MAG: SDR family NAD(P)-dependent oxidoreductase [Euryarchaeota archaeon]|nr:SDR family NAD(P)-dependent oxidoreductase [Euryarchaeota archaeon]MDE1836720.1 SDR family NAD(P)-dependent oxidoreductase [Euryarchaeota archaeon]MDE1881749.1 SDR family NAD(P)-dependent oxidoreductase [Euryarchaeota archaeon]MDE2044704.1 SDR family NAD(P)-dependent oxidoreductase [Thermoplasmata archaeon]
MASTKSRRSTSSKPISKPPEEGWALARTRPLRGQVAVVAGGTRGAGRAIAVSLGLAGATVYVTGRSVRGHPATPGRPETIDQTAEMIRALGGRAVAVRVDHTEESEVRRFFEQVRREQRGKLDVLVNDIWGGEPLIEWGKAPWEMTWRMGRTLIERAVFTHILTSRYAVPLMVARKSGTIFEVTDGAHLQYRGSYFYDFVKSSVIRMALAYHEEFEEAGLRRMSTIAVTPGYLRSEYMLDQFGVREENWRDGIPQAGPGYRHSETPYYLARGVVALAADPMRRRYSGKVVGSWTLGHRYGFTDRDGTQPDWGAYFYPKYMKGVEPTS